MPEHGRWRNVTARTVPSRSSMVSLEESAQFKRDTALGELIRCYFEWRTAGSVALFAELQCMRADAEIFRIRYRRKYRGRSVITGSNRQRADSYENAARD